MLPKTLALIDDDQDYTELLATHLRDQGVEVDVYHDGKDQITSPRAFDYDFYVLELILPGFDGLTLIDLLRRRTNAGIVVVSVEAGFNAVKDVIRGGADMYLMKPVHCAQTAVAIRAVQSRIVTSRLANQTWKLDRRAKQLISPSGQRADLSDIDLSVLERFVAANGGTVTRESLHDVLSAALVNVRVNLNATMYRLRRRIERTTPLPVPLQAKSKVGYVFQAPLTAV